MGFLRFDYHDKAKREKRKSKNKYSHNVHEIEYTYFDDMTVGYGEYVEGPLSDRNVFRGVEIDITYNSGVSIEGAYWMQEITTDYPNAYDRRRAVVKKINNTLVYTYWDDGHGERNGRYYTEAEMKQHTSNNGKKITFYDCPSRIYSDTNFWNAKLYLVYNNRAILTITYGFTTTKGIPTRTGMGIFYHQPK